ncbi:MAG: MG2 domain-containing protein [Myxococcaceae bacterium]
MATTKKKLVIGTLVGAPVVVFLLILSTQVCISAWVTYGVALDRCPDGKPRQTVVIDTQGLTRGRTGVVRVGARMNYTTGASDWAMQAPIERFTPTLSLVAAGKETPLTSPDGWTKSGSMQALSFEFPQVNDGDYFLRAKVSSKLGESSYDLPLPVYSPARIHVITDRPLYEPGNTVKFRAVVFRAKDLSPLDARPGTWFVTDPSGEVLLEEIAPAGDWGVVHGSFPLDKGAQSGDWRVRWISGGAGDEVSFKVQPFTLPRFRIEAETAKPFYRRGERPVLRGKVVYSSGAPVANAAVALAWDVSGDWPAPTSWEDGSGLPSAAKAGANGRFSVDLPAVPEDLQKQATLSARLSATDAAGDRVEGSASILLSEDPIQVSAVTELEDGLVEGFNNRLYLRALTADGRVLPGVQLTVKRAWEPKDKGVNAAADEDGVASLQLDPGPAVNVVIPPAPFRPPQKEPAVSREGVAELFSDEEPSLADQVAMEAWERALEPCARWVHNDEEEVNLGLRVSASGQILSTAAPASRLGACVAGALKARRLPAGKERLYSVRLGFQDSELPKLFVEVEGVPDTPELIYPELSEAVFGARDCLASTVPSAMLPRMLEWRTQPKSKEVKLGWTRNPEGEPFPAAALSCIEGRLKTLTLSKEQDIEALGFARLRVQAPEKYESVRPQATTMIGYEFTVTARKGDEVLGTTRMLMRPGTVPQVRLRATPTLAKAGEPIDVEILRGPDFTGALPEKLFFYYGGTSREALVDPKTRTAHFTFPAGVEGWLETNWSGARALVYVRPQAQLAVSLKPEQERYAPGALARLNLETTVGGAGAKAAVGLVGVDESLGQLAPLPGPDELVRVRPRVEVTSKAFGALDAQALTMGRIRGGNAAAATILRVSTLPSPAELDAPVYGNGASSFDPVEELTDHFYVALGELHTQARSWEESAPAAEKMSPRIMAALWERALDECEKRKEPVTDAYGRRLKLSRLPSDLLSLTDPRAVIVAGTRLPEDVENWSGWVAKEQP